MALRQALLRRLVSLIILFLFFIWALPLPPRGGCGSGYRFTETAPASGLVFARYAHGACFARFAYMLRTGALAYRLYSFTLFTVLLRRFVRVAHGVASFAALMETVRLCKPNEVQVM
jgi:hypothetical protein